MEPSMDSTVTSPAWEEVLEEGVVYGGGGIGGEVGVDKRCCFYFSLYGGGAGGEMGVVDADANVWSEEVDEACAVEGEELFEADGWWAAGDVGEEVVEGAVDVFAEVGEGESA